MGPRIEGVCVSVREVMKATARLVAHVAATPFVWSFTLRAAIVGRDRAIQSSTQLLALVPGLTGQYLRRAFLSRTIAALSSHGGRRIRHDVLARRRAARRAGLHRPRMSSRSGPRRARRADRGGRADPERREDPPDRRVTAVDPGSAVRPSGWSGSARAAGLAPPRSSWPMSGRTRWSEPARS